MSDYALRFFNAQPAVSEDRTLVEFTVSDGVVPRRPKTAPSGAELIESNVRGQALSLKTPYQVSRAKRAHFRKSRKSRFLNRLA